MNYPYGIKGERDVKVCALSGRDIRPGDVAVSVTGTKLFFRVSSQFYNQLTPDKRAEIEAAIKADAGKTGESVPGFLAHPEAPVAENFNTSRGFRKAKDGGDTPEAEGN